MSYNFLDKTGLTYFYDKIKTIFAKKSEIPTKTSQLTNDSNLNYSIEKPSGTIDDLAAFTSGKPGITGSISLTKKASGIGSEIPAGWYNFYFAPHRTGSGGDNMNFGTILLTPMNFAGKSWILRRSSSANAISEVKSIITNDLFKTSLITNDAAFIKNSAYYINIHPENSPVLIPFIHNDIAFLLKRGGSAKIYYDNVETSLDISNVFDGSGSYWAINPTGVTQIIIELTLHQTFAWTNTIYFDFGAAGWRAKHVKIEVMNTNYSQDVWTQKYNNTNNGSGNGMVVTSHQPVGASNQGGGFNKVRFTFDTWNTATIFRISQLGIYNYGSKGVRETYMSRGIDDYIFRNITPNSNNTYDLGSSSNKWKNIYANNVEAANIAVNKTLTNENLNNVTTPGFYNAGGGNTCANKPSGVDHFGLYVVHRASGSYYTQRIFNDTAQYTRKCVNGTWGSWSEDKLTDTTYSNKAAASGGTDVSLVTTGEKYTWNNKTSNTGTVTSVAVKMNNTTKGTVTTSGTIDLGTVITSHQDISGKQDKLATQTAYTSKGSATKVPQITTNTLGQVTGITEVTITQPTVNNGTLTIQKNGTNVQTFSANQSGNATANITVPTNVSDLNNDSNFTSKTYVDNTINDVKTSLVPVGVIFPFASDVAPTGYLLCDGSEISRTTYSELFTVIGTTYGEGDGSSTFNLPDLRRRYPLMKGTNDTLGATGGSEVIYAMANPRSNGFNYKNAAASFISDYWIDGWNSGAKNYGGRENSNAGISIQGATDTTSSREPYLICNYIIRAYTGVSSSN